jgi:all-trans-8'-apo-beta-carotenal 15,15'-oxygenase
MTLESTDTSMKAPVIDIVEQPNDTGDPRRIFGSMLDEHDYTITETEGALPEGLIGTLYRNGPGNWEVGGQPLEHIFDGDGMLSMFAFDGTSVRYRNRYVRTEHYLAGLNSVGVPQRGLGTLKPGGILANAFRGPANTANTNVMLHDGQLLALWEFGNPHALDPDTLATQGTYDFDGELGWLGTFSAHPKWDPATGEVYNFGFELSPRPVLRCYRLDTTGHLHRVRDVPLPEPVNNHDFALTDKHMVFVIDPIIVELKNMPAVALGMKSFDEALTFKASKGTTIVLVPRDGTRPTVIQTEALMHFHVSNAYEDGTDTVVDLVEWKQSWEELRPELRGFRDSDLEAPLFGGNLTRLRITKAATVTREVLSDAKGDFPQFDWRRSAQEHRYSYLAALSENSGVPNAIVKVDSATGSEQVHELPVGHMVGEPIFVPRSASAAEDDGWLLAVAYDSSVHRSRLLVLDATNPEGEAVFVGHLPHHIPPGFHGTFTSRVAKIPTS